MVEILISMLLLSLGIMGAIKMQLAAAQTSQQSTFYSAATELASEMADKIRSNIDPSNPYVNINFQTGRDHPSGATCFTSRCTPEQLANAEISEWLQRVSTALPNAHAVVCRDSPQKLTWNCAANDNAGVVIKLGWAEHTASNKNPPPLLAIAVTP